MCFICWSLYFWSYYSFSLILSSIYLSQSPFSFSLLSIFLIYFSFYFNLSSRELHYVYKVFICSFFYLSSEANLSFVDPYLALVISDSLIMPLRWLTFSSSYLTSLFFEFIIRSLSFSSYLNFSLKILLSSRILLLPIFYSSRIPLFNSTYLSYFPINRFWS